MKEIIIRIFCDDETSAQRGTVTELNDLRQVRAEVEKLEDLMPYNGLNFIAVEVL